VRAAREHLRVIGWTTATTLLACCLLALGGAAAAAGADGLVVAYAFDEGAGGAAADASGSGRDGALTGGATWTSGRYGAAVSLDGVSGRVEVPALGTFYRSGFTLEAWVKPRTAPSDATVLGTWVSGDDGGPMIWVDHLVGRYRLTLNKGVVSDYLDSGQTPLVGQWQHLAATYDGAVARFYVDGVETASKAFTGNVGDSNTWRVGAYGPGPGGFFDGAVDEVRVYDRALSAQEILEDVATPVGSQDVTPPTAPGGFAQTSATTDQIATAWAASTDDVGVTGYRLIRDGVTIGVTSETTFTFTGLECGASYSLGVEALDAGGNASPRSALAAQTAACPPGTPQGLVAAYAFDEAGGGMAMDESGNHHMATILGAAWTAGRFGSALSFSGGGERVDLPPLGTFYKSGFTLEAWVKPTIAPHDAAVLGSWVSGDDGGPMIWVDHLSGRLFLTLNRGFGNYLDSGRTPVVGEWQHVAATFDGLVARFYVAGVETASRTFFGNAGDSNTWRVGAYGSGPAGFFPGALDEIRIYDRALGAAEIAADVGRSVGMPDAEPPSQPAHLVRAGAGATSIEVHWNAATDNVGVAGYRLLRDGVAVGTTTATAFTFTGLACNTEYTLGVEAFDEAGNASARSTTTAATRACDTTPPTVSVTLPADGSTVAGTVTVAAIAVDDDAVAGVEFLLNGSPIAAEVTSPPFVVAWNTHTALRGAHVLTAVARDASGNTATSAPITVTVDNSGTPPPGLVAAYALDEGTGILALDASGAGRTATLAGGTWTESGKVNFDVSLNGTSDRIDLPALGTFYKNGFTFEAWVKKRGEKADAAVLGTWTSGDDGGPMIWVDHVAGRYRLTLGKAALGDYLDSGQSPAVGQWQHVAATYDGAVARFYVDGIQAASTPFGGNMGNSNTWRLGAYGATPGGFFDGAIDEVRIYDRALSVEEIQADLATGVAPPDLEDPAAPGAFRTTGATVGSIATAWDAATDNVRVAGYRLYRNGTQVGTTTDTQFAFANLACGTSFELGVEAYDGADNVSPRSTLTASTSACDTTPPTVTLTEPSPGAVLANTVSLSADAQDNDALAGVRFTVDGLPVGSVLTSAPFTLLWDSRAVANGLHVIRAVATDASGNATTSSLVLVFVQNTATSVAGLVAAFSFDEGAGTIASDDSGHGNGGTLQGAGWGIGRFGSSATFDGMGDLVTIPDSASLDLAGALTLEAWVLPTSLGDEWQTVLFKEQPANVVYSLYASSTGGIPATSVFVAGSENDVRGPDGLVEGEWNHLASTYDGSTLRLYVNGTLVATRPIAGALQASDGPLRIGGNGVWPEWFAGRIDEVRVYGRALSQGEIQSDMATRVAADTNPPAVVSTTPAAGATGVNVGATVKARFSEALDPGSVSTATFHVDGPGGPVPATVSYDAVSGTATLTVTSALLYGTTYTATVAGGTSGPRVQDLAGNALALPHTWTFTTEASPPPILVVEIPANPYGAYAGEILKAEGLPFTTIGLPLVTSDLLSSFDVVLLGETPLTVAQAQMLTAWVEGGGNLVAFRPDKRLASLLGLSDAGGVLSEGYVLANTSSAPGAGIVGQTIQFHGTADRYLATGARTVATLYSGAATPTPNPAVTVNDVGANGGQAAAFTYDLSRSIVLTRQGNPAWIGQERDGVQPIRPDDLFFGGAIGDDQTDWVDTTRIEIPQADEQQRLLVNLIEDVASDRAPIPRFWYLPGGEKAAVVMTGDDHALGGTAGRFDRYLALSPAGCSVVDWECVRATSYIYPTSPLTPAEATAYTAQGFEVAVHLSSNCQNWTPASLDADFTRQLNDFASRYAGVPAPVSNRTHCVAWSDWASQPKIELEHGIRLDTNYYHYPGAWIGSKSGFMTGSGIPMRFADLDGSLIDVFQAATHMTDESGQAYPTTVDALLDRALGPEGYYGIFTANMHTDHAEHAGSDAIVASAQARSVPIISSKQLLTWLDGREASSFRAVAWNAGTLTFSIQAGAGARGLQAMLPTHSDAGTLTGLSRGGSPVLYSTETIKGIEYALFPAVDGDYAATYG
jgi:chitodextrinase